MGRVGRGFELLLCVFVHQPEREVIVSMCFSLDVGVEAVERRTFGKMTWPSLVA